MVKMKVNAVNNSGRKKEPLLARLFLICFSLYFQRHAISKRKSKGPRYAPNKIVFIIQIDIIRASQFSMDF